MENEQGIVVEGATPTQQTDTQQVAPEDTAPATVPQEQVSDSQPATATGSEGNSATENVQEATPFLSFKHNHEPVNLTQEQAVDWAQKGMKYQSVYDKICRAAALNGVDPGEYINSLENAADERYRQELIERHGEDEDTINQLMELYQMKKESTISAAETARKQSAESQRQTSAQRIAGEFVQMQKDFPELAGTEYAALPAQVKAAADEGMPLAYAYLLQQRIEQNKKQAAEQQATQASNASTGSLGTEQNDTQSAFEKGFLAGLWGR